MSVHDTVPVTTTAPTTAAPAAVPIVPIAAGHVEWRDVGPGEGAHRASQPWGPARRSRPRGSVNNTHCELYGICEQEAPGVFELRVDGRLRYAARPGQEHLAGVRQAARCCPMQAITVTESR